VGDVILELLPVMLVVATIPFSPIIVLLLLLGENGLRKATAFVVGNTAVRLLQGIIFSLAVDRADDKYGDDGPGVIAATLMLVLGIFLLNAAYKKWQKEEDPDAPPPQWMASLSGMSPLKAAGAGALYILVSPKQWVLTLAAISTIGAADLGGLTDAGLYLLYVLVAQLLIVTPLVMYALSPAKADKPLRAAQAWLERHSTTILIVVSLIFGVVLFYKGFMGLFG